MNLPKQIQSLLQKKPKSKEVFLSLLVETAVVQGAVWSICGSGKIVIEAYAGADVAKDSWDERIHTADVVITQLEEKSGISDIHKVVFGFPSEYLMENGDIDISIRGQLKKLTEALRLTPIGFVDINTALVFSLKREEGIPPSVILIHAVDHAFEISLIKVGIFIGIKTIKKTDFVASDVEDAIRSFTDIEVLPSRMLLYGLNRDELEAIKSDLLIHQWPSRSNFLHFPKIEALSVEDMTKAVSLAGASEIVSKMSNRELTMETVKEEKPLEEGSEIQSEETHSIDEEKKQANETDGIKPPEDETLVEETNIKIVNPEALGFHTGIDVLEAGEAIPKSALPVHEDEFPKKQSQTKEISEQNIAGQQKSISNIIKSVFLKTKNLAGHVQHISKGKKLSKRKLLFFPFFVVLGTGVWFLYSWVVPTASVTLTVIPFTIEESQKIFVDTGVTEINSEKGIIPGKKQEKTVSGEKTIAVTGKKKVGDPAKGIVTLYNKSQTTKMLKKGTTLLSGLPGFTIDNDVSVASASENISQSQLTYGKENVAVTASTIGAESNVPASSDFSIKDTSTGILMGRNEKAFTGGTSRDVTVVTRSDYDTLVTSITAELIDRAKTDLASLVSGKEKLIDSTIKTSVSEKVFREELDQEAKELHGKVTVAVSGISYSEQDILSFFSKTMSQTIPSGYIISEGRTRATIVSGAVNKNNTISMDARIKGIALPTVDSNELKKKLSGKTITEAQSIIQNLGGMQSAEFSFQRNMGSRRLPIHFNNISITVTVGE